MTVLQRAHIGCLHWLGQSCRRTASRTFSARSTGYRIQLLQILHLFQLRGHTGAKRHHVFLGIWQFAFVPRGDGVGHFVGREYKFLAVVRRHTGGIGQSHEFDVLDLVGTAMCPGNHVALD